MEQQVWKRVSQFPLKLNTHYPALPLIGGRKCIFPEKPDADVYSGFINRCHQTGQGPDVRGLVRANKQMVRLSRREQLSNDEDRTTGATTWVKNLRGFVLSARSQTRKAGRGICPFV